MRQKFFAALVVVAIAAVAKSLVSSPPAIGQVVPSGAPTVFTSPLPSFSPSPAPSAM
jgi:hypothetical protein